mgnify:CR=1 FL=1
MVARISLNMSTHLFINQKVRKNPSFHVISLVMVRSGDALIHRTPFINPHRVSCKGVRRTPSFFFDTASPVNHFLPALLLLLHGDANSGFYFQHGSDDFP